MSPHTKLAEKKFVAQPRLVPNQWQYLELTNAVACSPASSTFTATFLSGPNPVNDLQACIYKLLNRSIFAGTIVSKFNSLTLPVKVP